jgi:hypothetical protein
LSARSTRLRGGGVTFRPGRRPRMLAWRPWSTSGLPCAAWAAGGRVVRRCGSCVSGGMSGWRSRKVVLVVCWAKRSGWMSGRRPRTLAVLRALTLCRVDDKVALDADRRRRFGAAPRRVGFFIFVRASRVCSSHSSYGVFSPAMVKDRLVFDGVVFRDGACLFRS